MKWHECVQRMAEGGEVKRVRDATARGKLKMQNKAVQNDLQNLGLVDRKAARCQVAWINAIM